MDIHQQTPENLSPKAQYIKLCEEIFAQPYSRSTYILVNQASQLLKEHPEIGEDEEVRKLIADHRISIGLHENTEMYLMPASISRSYIDSISADTRAQLLAQVAVELESYDTSLCSVTGGSDAMLGKFDDNPQIPKTRGGRRISDALLPDALDPEKNKDLIEKSKKALISLILQGRSAIEENCVRLIPKTCIDNDFRMKLAQAAALGASAAVICELFSLGLLTAHEAQYQPLREKAFSQFLRITSGAARNAYEDPSRQHLFARCLRGLVKAGLLDEDFRNNPQLTEAVDDLFTASKVQLTRGRERPLLSEEVYKKTVSYEVLQALYDLGLLSDGEKLKPNVETALTKKEWGAYGSYIFAREKGVSAKLPQDELDILRVNELIGVIDRMPAKDKDDIAQKAVTWAKGRMDGGIHMPKECISLFTGLRGHYDQKTVHDIAWAKVQSFQSPHGFVEAYFHELKAALESGMIRVEDIRDQQEIKDAVKNLVTWYVISHRDPLIENIKMLVTMGVLSELPAQEVNDGLALALFSRDRGGSLRELRESIIAFRDAGLARVSGIRELVRYGHREGLIDARALEDITRDMSGHFAPDDIEKAVSLARIQNAKAAELGVSRQEGEHIVLFQNYEELSVLPKLEARKRIFEMMHPHRMDATRVGYDAYLNYFDNSVESQELLWEYLNGVSYHDHLQHVPHFLTTLDNDPNNKRLILALMRKATKPTQNQHTHQANRMSLSMIMGEMTSVMWHRLKTETWKDNAKPVLRNVQSVSLKNILNAMHFFSRKYLRENLDMPGMYSEPLKQFINGLIEVPGIDAEALVNFANDPAVFFASRSGINETLPQYDTAFTKLAPAQWQGGWYSSDSEPADDASFEVREGIADGSFEQMNVFPACSASWSDLDSCEPKTGSALEFSALGERYAKLSDGEKSSCDAILHSLRSKLFLDAISMHQEKARQHIDQSKKQIIGAIERYVQSNNPRFETQKLHDAVTNPVEFWQLAAQSGWLRNAHLLHILDRIGIIKKEETNGKGIIAEIETLLKVVDADTTREGIRPEFTELYEILKTTSAATYYDAHVMYPGKHEAILAAQNAGKCDTFGTGKYAHYLVNSGIAHLVLYERKGNAHEKDLLCFSACSLERPHADAAQALTLNTDLLRSHLRRTPKEYVAMLDASHDSHIALDSAEIPSRKIGKIGREELRVVLGEAFAQLAQVNNFYDKNVTSGHHACIFDNNEFVKRNLVDHAGYPCTPFVYSDNRNVTAIPIHSATKKSANARGEKLGVRPATGNDATIIALIENIAFTRSNGQNLLCGPHDMTTRLWGSCFQAVHRKHKPLSFISVVEYEGKPIYNGYLIAQDYGSKIYLNDCSTIGVAPGSAQGMFMAVLENVATDPKIRKTILMDTRAVTSAKAFARKESRAMIESLRFPIEDGKTVAFEITGPTEEELDPNRLNRFVLKPYII